MPISFKKFWGIDEAKYKGYKTAFFKPPYGLKGETTYHMVVYDRINDIIFDNVKDGIEIYKWSDDWSNYFDDGKEWWGTYYWTVFSPTKNAFIVIAGSATD